MRLLRRTQLPRELLLLGHRFVRSFASHIASLTQGGYATLGRKRYAESLEFRGLFYRLQDGGAPCLRRFACSHLAGRPIADADAAEFGVLGGTYAFGIVPSIMAVDVDVGIQLPGFTGPRGNTFGPTNFDVSDHNLALGDTGLIPIVLGWNAGNFHWSMSAFGLAPTGDYDTRQLANASLNRWAVMPRLAATYFDPSKEGTMGVWAEPFTTLRLQKIFNVMQDPFERADITSNTFWDWQINHVGSMYGVMDQMFQFVETFKEFPPRSFPPSFNPANIMEQTMEDLKTRKMLKENIDPNRIRGEFNKVIEEKLKERSMQ